MTFLPEKMLVAREVVDSEDDEDVEEQETHHTARTRTETKSPENKTSRRGKKRSSDVMERESEDEGPIRPTPKRIRRSNQRLKSCSSTIDVEPASEEEEDEAPIPRLRKQSTMTQLMEGRRPGPEDEEPEFKPVKRRSRTSWSSAKGKARAKDQQQRTLTQMVPGLGSFGTVSDSEEEATQDEDNGAYNDALVEHFAEQGLHNPVMGRGEQNKVKSDVEQCTGSMGDAEAAGPSATQIDDLNTIGANADDKGDDEEDESQYYPTQFIDTIPTLTTRRTSRRLSGKLNAEPGIASTTVSSPRKRTRPRFSLLATPERRRIREIPSSQSPAESSLSTQTTPDTSRSPLKQRSGNIQKTQDTPSKRKQVTFQEPVQKATPPPIVFQRFASTIQDSEEEEEEDGPDDGVPDFPSGQVDIGAETQALICRIDGPVGGRAIGADTQAMLEKIDQACANTEEDTAIDERESSEELGDHPPKFVRRESSQILGEQRMQGRAEHEATDPQAYGSEYYAEHTRVKQEPQDEDSLDLPEHTRNLASSRMLIKDEPDEEELAPPTPHYTPTFLQHQTPQEQTDLDGEPLQIIRSSPPAPPETQDTSVSHSSKAEQQLQSEWFSYSQYPKVLPSSSLHVAHDASSYQQATPFSNTIDRAMAPPRWSAPLSQATTVDPTQRSPHVTPKKPRSKLPSANTTPHRIPRTPPLFSPDERSHSQPISSSQRPPPLVIASSFPSSPSRGSGSNRGWSSPMMGMTQFENGMASIEDFSIPPLPPVEYDDDEE